MVTFFSPPSPEKLFSAIRPNAAAAAAAAPISE